MSSLITFLRDWWPFFFLIYLPLAINLVSSGLAIVIKSRLDHLFPDDLPMTAGEWLAEQLKKTGLNTQVRSVVTSGPGALSVDGYYPRSGVIQLSVETYFKKDPVFWATAGHELGHAMFHRSHPSVSTFLATAGWFKWILSNLGMAVLLGNVLYAMPQALLLAYYCLTAALILDILVLIDEAVASTLAIILLRRDSALSTAHLRGAFVSLFASFCTYASQFLCYFVLLSQWDRLVALTGTGRFTDVAAPLTGWRFALLVVCTVFAAVHVAFVLMQVIRPAQHHRAEKGRIIDSSEGCITPLVSLAWKIMLGWVLVLLWDRSADPAYWWCVLLAFVPMLGWIYLFFMAPLAVVFRALRAVRARIIERFGQIDKTRVYRDAKYDGEKQTERGNQAVASLIVDSLNNPPLGNRLAEVFQLLYVPLFVVYWL